MIIGRRLDITKNIILPKLQVYVNKLKYIA